MLTLPIEKRDVKESAVALRARGFVPGVFYGPREESTPISISTTVFNKLWKEAGETTIVSLIGVGEPKEVLVQEVVEHPVTGAPQHVDFYVLEKGKKIEISVPIEFVGTALAEKEGGVVVKVLHEIEIRVAPAELPQHFTIDVTSLAKIGDQISASEIVLPPSAELITGPEEIIVSITAQEIIEEMETKPPTDEEAAAADTPAKEVAEE
ncbi:MAG: 50S ribosomal protein L25 [Patescibacteria group bacterium]